MNDLWINNEKKLEKKMARKQKLNKILMLVCFFILIPAVIFIGVAVFKDRSYNVISIAIAILACVPFFLNFEKKKHSSRELIIMAALTAISVLGRVIFYPLPGFKPVTAIVVISAIYLGKECGFITGAMSAIVSNLFFGQGPWTPFQMFAWGSLGFFTGSLSKYAFMKNAWAQILVGVIGGILYSLLMDIWTVLSISGTFNMSIYLTAILFSLPWMGIYAVSNVVFLLLLSKPIGEKLNRLKTKFDIFSVK